MATPTLQNPSRRRAQTLLTGLLITTLLLTGCALPLREQHLPTTCQGEACQYTAAKSPWPIVVWPGKTRDYQLGPFSINLPETALSESDEHHIMLFLDKNEAVQLKLVASADFDFKFHSDQFEKSRYAVTDYIDLLFTQPATAQEPDAQMADRYIWRMAMANKQDYFEHGGPLHKANKNNVSLYWSRVYLGQMSYLGFITDRRHPDIALAVYGYHLPETLFKAVLAGIIQKE